MDNEDHLDERQRNMVKCIDEQMHEPNKEADYILKQFKVEELFVIRQFIVSFS